MRLKIFSAVLSWVISLPTFSQSKTVDYFDGTISFAKNEGSLAFHYTHLWKIGKAQKLSLGLGGRFTSYLGSNQNYITAPAKLTSGSTGPFVIFKENLVENIDSLVIKSPFVNSINLSINIQYGFSSKITVGFNIDAIGFSFGGKKQGNYINGSIGSITSGKPTGFNILLISDNDRGSLNSELFARYQLNDKWSVKGGVVFLFTEYTTDTKVQQFPEANDRFRNKSLMLGLGVSYTLR